MSHRIADTDVHLVYVSSDSPGYMSTVVMQLTSSHVPDDLAVVHLRVAVEGVVDERRFEARSYLKYTFAWDRRNGYNQKVYGIVTARGETRNTTFIRSCLCVFVCSHVQWMSVLSTHLVRESSGTVKRRH